MISMSQTYSIRQLRKSGESISEIARKVGVSRNTVYAKLAAPRPVAADAGEGAQGDDARRVQAGHRGVPRRGRADLAQAKAHRAPHLAAPSRRARRRLQRVHRQALRPRPQGPEEKRRRILPRPCLEPRRGAGRLRGGRLRHRRRKAQDELLRALLPVLQHGVRQVFPSENAECVCQALKQIFEYVGGVPTRIVFDNATGVGRRVCDGVRTAETFAAFAAHYGFAFSFCNP